METIDEWAIQLDEVVVPLNPVEGILRALPKGCVDCQPFFRRQAEMLGYFVGERVPTVENAAALILERLHCTHDNPEK